MNEEKVSKREPDERGEGMHADIEYGRGACGGEEIVKEEEMGVSHGMKESVCKDEVREQHVFSITHETWWTDGEKEAKERAEMEEETEMEERREMEAVADMRFQWRFVLERAMALKTLWCVLDLRLEVW